MSSNDAVANVPLPTKRATNEISYISVGQLVLDKREPVWVVPQLLEAGALTVVAGDPKLAQKTLLMQWLSVCAATGRNFLDRPIDRVWQVLYTAHEESVVSTSSRYRRFGVPDNAQIPLHITFDDDGFRLALRAAENAEHPFLWIIDTLAVTSVLHGLSDEGKPDQMTKLLHPYRRLAHATGSAIIFVHHFDKAQGKMRGSTALPAAISGWWEIKHRRSSDARQIDYSQRDGPHGSCGFELVVRPDGQWAFEGRDAPGIKSRPQEEAIEMAEAVADAKERGRPGRKAEFSDASIDAGIIAQLQAALANSVPWLGKTVVLKAVSGKGTRKIERFDALVEAGQIESGSGGFRLANGIGG